MDQSSQDSQQLPPVSQDNQTQAQPQPSQQGVVYQRQADQQVAQPEPGSDAGAVPEQGVKPQQPAEHAKASFQQQAPHADQVSGEDPSVGAASSQPDLSSPTSTSTDDLAGAGGVAGESKEREPIAPSESVPLVELREQMELEPEVEGWLEHLEHSGQVQMPKVVMDEESRALLEEAEVEIVDDAIVLPMTHDEVEKGLHHKVVDSVRWLAEWCMRVVKMFGKQVRFRDD